MVVDEPGISVRVFPLISTNTIVFSKPTKPVLLLAFVPDMTDALEIISFLELFREERGFWQARDYASELFRVHSYRLMPSIMLPHIIRRFGTHCLEMLENA